MPPSKDMDLHPVHRQFKSTNANMHNPKKEEDLHQEALEEAFNIQLSLAERVQTWKDRYTKTSQVLQKVANDHKALKDLHSEAKENYKELLGDHKSLKASHSKIKGEYLELLGKHQSLKSTHAKHLEEKTRDLEQACMELSGDRKKILSHMDSCKHQLEASKTECNELKETLMSLAKAGETTSRQNDKLKKDLLQSKGDDSHHKTKQALSEALDQAQSLKASHNKTKQAHKTVSERLARAESMLTGVDEVLKACSDYHKQNNSPLAEVLKESRHNLASFIAS